MLVVGYPRFDIAGIAEQNATQFWSIATLVWKKKAQQIYAIDKYTQMYWKPSGENRFYATHKNCVMSNAGTTPFESTHPYIYGRFRVESSREV